MKNSVRCLVAVLAFIPLVTIAQTTTSSVGQPSCQAFTRVLHIGSSGADVTRLQQFLATDPSTYPSGTASGYFGILTRAAVEAWQIKYGVVSSGTEVTTGFGMVGPRTAAAIASRCSGGALPASKSPVSGQTTVNTNQSTGTISPSPSVSGQVQTPAQPTTANIPTDSVNASINSGTAPLSVTFSGTVSNVASIGCVGTCNEFLNYGDGGVGLVPLPATVGTWQNFTLTHTYTSAGNYAAQLRSVTNAPVGGSISITVTSPTPVVTGPTPTVSATTTATYSCTVASQTQCGAGYHKCVGASCQHIGYILGQPYFCLASENPIITVPIPVGAVFPTTSCYNGSDMSLGPINASVDYFGCPLANACVPN
jgi:peptidoglycan hydrolase-like protein with peptidoglycan-binding domain